MLDHYKKNHDQIEIETSTKVFQSQLDFGHICVLWLFKKNNLLRTRSNKYVFNCFDVDINYFLTILNIFFYTP